MKKIYFSVFTFLVVLISCQNTKSNSQEKIESLHIELNETKLSTRSDSIDFTTLPRLSKAQYDSLQISKISDLKDYDVNYLSMGHVLLSNESGKIITINIITEGEITEYLLSYDKDGNLVDNLIVAYEDMVEYYSQISSQINSERITVQTIDFIYENEKGKPVELSDTSIANYQITPELKFIKR